MNLWISVLFGHLALSLKLLLRFSTGLGSFLIFLFMGYLSCIEPAVLCHNLLCQDNSFQTTLFMPKYGLENWIRKKYKKPTLSFRGLQLHLQWAWWLVFNENTFQIHEVFPSLPSRVADLGFLLRLMLQRSNLFYSTSPSSGVSLDFSRYLCLLAIVQLSADFILASSSRQPTPSLLAFSRISNPCPKHSLQ